MIDYYLPQNASKVTLEIFDAKGALVRRYVSGEKKSERRAGADCGAMVAAAGFAGYGGGNASVCLGLAVG